MSIWRCARCRCEVRSAGLPDGWGGFVAKLQDGRKQATCETCLPLVEDFLRELDARRGNRHLDDVGPKRRLRRIKW